MNLRLWGWPERQCSGFNRARSRYSVMNPKKQRSGPPEHAAMRTLTTLIVICGFPLGCHTAHGVPEKPVRGAPTTAESSRTATSRVPAHPPDSIAQAVWDSLFVPSNLMTNAPGLHGTWVRNIMMITFKRTATLAERQALIDLIHGEVIGGNPPMGDEGEYIVRIPYAAPGDTISGPVRRAFRALHGNPAIVAVYPISTESGIKLP